MNSTECPSGKHDNPLCFHTTGYPFYYSPKAQLVDGIPDHLLTLAAPVIAYWALSLFFHFLDISEWKWLDKYRIHESEEAKSKNLVTKSQVVWAVIFQQVIQTGLGLAALSDDSSHLVNHRLHLLRIATYVERCLPWLSGSPRVLARFTEFVYWWGIPALQFLGAMYVLLNHCTFLLIFQRFVIDTWQYFLHRWMHTNKFLYKHCHSWHHRLYVPYAFGSLYNHPVEGFLLDSLGAVLAETLTRMNTRQAMILFTFSSLKTVDDHCGYNLPWDPLQLMSKNNADYHDIHHQVRCFSSILAYLVVNVAP